jgi:hypothetical protein
LLKSNLLKAFSDTQKGLYHEVKTGNSLNNNNVISIQSYKYIDSVPVLVPRMETYGTKLHGHKLVERTGRMFISGNDTLKINR